MPGRSNDSTSLALVPWVLAIAVHLAVPLAARLAPVSSRPLSARSSGSQRLEAIDVEVASLPPGRAEGSEAGMRSGEPRLDRGPVDPRRRRGAAAEVGEPQASTPSTPAPSALPPAEYDTPPDDGRDAVLAPGLDGKPIWAIPGAVARPDVPAPAPTTGDAPRAVDRDIAGQLLRGDQAARDKRLGLDLPAAGTVASAVADAVRGTDAPGASKATFEVRLDPAGRVLWIRAVRSMGGSPEIWDRVARLATARLAKAKLAMTGAYAAGATVVVDVVSVVQLPAGNPVGASEMVKPGPPTGTVGGGFKFDLSNVGAHGGRNVTSSYRVFPAR